MAEIEISKSGQVKLISESFVKPKYKVEASNQPLYLTPNALLLLSVHYTQRGMIFSTCNSTYANNIHTFLEKLTHSLSLSLVQFYPLAGQLVTEKFPEEHASLIYVDSNKGPGARIYHASLDVNVSDLISLSGEMSPTLQFLFDLGDMKVNHDGHTHPLLSIQVTELLDGIFMAFTMSHCLADGSSLWHFVSVLSQILLSTDQRFDVDNIPRKPIFKPFFPEGYGPKLKIKYLEPEEFVTRFEPGPMRGRVFHFSATSVAALKAKANEECRDQNPNIMISSFQALSGLLWRCITRARKPKPEEKVHCIIPVNFRPRLDPPLSEDHFGSFVCGAQSSVTVEELLGQDLGWASMMIHKELAACNDKRVHGFLTWIAQASYVAQPKDTPDVVTFAGSARFDVYGPEFGFGKAVANPINYGGLTDGKVMANPGREGGGSIDLQIGLRPETMSALESDDEFINYVSELQF